MRMLACWMILTGSLLAGELTLTVKINGLKSDKGNVRAALHNQADAFPTKEEKALKLTNGKIENGSATLSFTGLDAGTCAVAVHHDVNGNGKLEANFLGIPKEPTGASNNPKARMGPPKFADAKFELKNNETLVVQIN